MWSNGEKTVPRTDLRRRGTHSSTSSQRRLMPKSDPFQKCSMCSNTICGFLQRSMASNARPVVLSCAHIVCDACFEKLCQTSGQTKDHSNVKCVLCRSTVTFAFLPSLDDIMPLSFCIDCAERMADSECLHCFKKLCSKCSEQHDRLSHSIKKEKSACDPLPLKYVQCWEHFRRIESRCQLCDQLLCSECPSNSNKENGCAKHNKTSLLSSDFSIEDSMLYAERLQEEIAAARNSAIGFRDELCTRANLLKNEVCAHIYYMMNAVLGRGFQLLAEIRQEEKAANRQLDEVVSRCNHAQRHLDTACELDEKARDINLLKDSDDADFYKCLSYQLFRPVFTLMKENQKSIPSNAVNLQLSVENVNTREIINKIGSWGSNITSTCGDLGSSALTRTLASLRSDEAWDAKTIPPSIGCDAVLDLHVTPREVPLFFLSAFNNLWMKFILNASKPDSFPVLQPGECDPVPPCSEVTSTMNDSPLAHHETQCFPSSSLEKQASTSIPFRASRLSTGIVVHRILALRAGEPAFYKAKDVLHLHEDLFCIGLRLCSKRSIRIKRTHLVRMVSEVLEKIDLDPSYSLRISYDEYPTDFWDATDMHDVEEIFDALCATTLFHGWPYTKLMPMAMVLYVANFHFNDFSRYFATQFDVETGSRKRCSEDSIFDHHNENGSAHPQVIKQGLSTTESFDEQVCHSPSSLSYRSVIADDKDSSSGRERERIIVKIRRCGTAPASHTDSNLSTHEEANCTQESDGGERQLDKDGSHAFCWTCNDNAANAEEVKGICSKCPRVFHAKCHIPPIAGSWDDTPDDWVCSICEQINDDGSPSSDLKLCYKVLLCCYEHADCASCFAQPVPESTPGYYKVIQNPMDLGTIAEQLQNNTLMSVPEFVEKMNTVFRNCSRFNPKNSPVAEAGRKVWQSFQAAVKRYLPSYTKDIWLYVSLHDRKVLLQKRRKKPLCSIDLKTSRLSSV